jgi:hypothetical protein
MSYRDDDKEYARPAHLSDWIKEFADRELQKDGNPFDDIKDIFNNKRSRDAVESRVQELSDRVGLSSLEKIAKDKEKIVGGLADGEPDEKYDQEQLDKGIEVEFDEHTNDKEKAKEIAKDHLEESEDFEDGKGGKYYDELEVLEERIKASSIMRLIALANFFDGEGSPDVAKAIDSKIQNMLDGTQLAKDEKDTTELPKKFEEFEGLDEFIHNACRTSGGHASVPAIQNRIREEFDKDIDINNKGLIQYIKNCLKEYEKCISDEMSDEHSGEYVTIIVVDEDDGNQKVLDVPTTDIR